MPDSAFVVPFEHRLRFAREVFGAGCEALDQLLVSDDERRARVMIAIDDGLAAAAPGLVEQAEAFAARRRDRLELVGPVVRVPGGETCKNDRGVLDGLLERMHAARVCRRSYVLVVGGGAVLDVVGFAASIFHRGVRLVRVPSTTLGQADSGVGVKSAVNAFGIKNLIGAFAVPWGVVNDESLLAHLDEGGWRDGFAEAVKVALLKDAAFYEEIRADAPRLLRRDMGAAVPVIRRSATLHWQHITAGGDPFEFRHARPLDFGHWAAHKLEEMTGFSLSHGHAVSVGLALDTMYAEMAGLARPGLAREVAACLAAIGLPVHHEAMADSGRLLEGLEQFREHLGGRLTVTLVRQPGVAFDVHEIDARVMVEASRRTGELARDLAGRANGSHAKGLHGAHGVKEANGRAASPTRAGAPATESRP